jgi:UDP-4-amino-4,6-dideoxy-N-acetyl-beta-L-altrosamine transaminase
MKSIPYGKQSISDADIDEVVKVLRSDWLTQGPKVREFEDALANQCGVKHCIVVSSGTMALHMACLAIDVQPGDYGLTSPLSFLASANCIMFCGGSVDFTDIDPGSLCMSTAKIKEYCENKRTPKVVIPVDFAGIPADLPGLWDLSREFGFKLLEDAAHAIGSSYIYEGNNYFCGSCAHTDMAVFSFHPVKTITSGEGGAVLTNNDELAAKIRLLANHGFERDPSRFIDKNVHPAFYHEMQLLGFNGRMTDIQCALGLSQIKRLSDFKSKRQELVKKYNLMFSYLEESGMILTPPWPDNTDPCYHLYPLRLGPNSKVNRDDVYNKLRQKGIYCQIHYIPIYSQPFYRERYNYPPEKFSETESYYSSCISLPLFPDMDQETVRFVGESVIEIVK